jgi:hypothetical protein
MSHLHRSPSRGFGRTGLLMLLALMMIALQFSVAAPGAHAAPKTNSISLVPTIQQINLVSGQLLASGTVSAIIKGTTTTVPFTGVPVTISLAGGTVGTCPILSLHLAPITVNLLGLVVQTSDICLRVTAYSGGGLLGQLLCSIGQQLQLNIPLSTILNGLSSTDLGTLTSGLTGLFNGALGQLINAVLGSIVTSTQQHTCAILHLSLGPVDLTLLGLNVHLDNCNNGAVTVDITGQTGQGKLLGNLLCELLAGGQLQLGMTLQQIINLILGLLNV